MTSRDFAYWLQGYFEITNPTTIGEKEIEVIKNHLNLVFFHEIDPSVNKKHESAGVSEMNKIHSGSSLTGGNDPNKIMRC